MRKFVLFIQRIIQILKPSPVLQEDWAEWHLDTWA